MPKIFISYAHEDGDFAHKLEKDLKACEAEVWIDAGELKVGDRIPDKIQKGIEESDFFGVVLSPHSVNSRWVEKEINIAKESYKERNSPTILPLLLEDYEPRTFIDDNNDWNIIFADFREESSYEGQFNKVVHAMGIILEKNIRNQYTIYDVRDISYASACRVVADILVDKGLPRTHVKRIISIANEEVKHQAYARNEMVKQKWGSIPAQIVGMFFYEDMEDLSTKNWICKTLWNSPDVDSDAKMDIKHNDVVDDILIDWSETHGTLKEIYRQHRMKKPKFIEIARGIRRDIQKIYEQARNVIEAYKSDRIKEDRYIAEMKKLNDDALQIFHRYNDLDLPPPVCAKADKLLEEASCLLSNALLPFSKDGILRWDADSRGYILENSMREFEDKINKFDDEFSELL